MKTIVQDFQKHETLESYSSNNKSHSNNVSSFTLCDWNNNGNHISICKSSIDTMSYYCYEWFLKTFFNGLLIQSVMFEIITLVV
jgi:hypothetical protein